MVSRVANIKKADGRDVGCEDTYTMGSGGCQKV
jgi:hypothetical protein